MLTIARIVYRLARYRHYRSEYSYARSLAWRLSAIEAERFQEEVRNHAHHP